MRAYVRNFNSHKIHSKIYYASSIKFPVYDKKWIIALMNPIAKIFTYFFEHAVKLKHKF